MSKKKIDNVTIYNRGGVAQNNLNNATVKSPKEVPLKQKLSIVLGRKGDF